MARHRLLRIPSSWQRNACLHDRFVHVHQKGRSPRIVSFLEACTHICKALARIWISRGEKRGCGPVHPDLDVIRIRSPRTNQKGPVHPYLYTKSLCLPDLSQPFSVCLCCHSHTGLAFFQHILVTTHLPNTNHCKGLVWPWRNASLPLPTRLKRPVT